MKQRGFALPDLMLILAIVGLIAAIAFGVEHYLTNLQAEAKAAGRAEALREVSERDNKKLVAANARILELEQQARGEEARRQSAVDSAVAKHSKEAANVKKQLDTLRAGLRDGTLLLRDPGAGSGTGCPGGGQRAGSSVAGDAAGGAGHIGGGVLSREASEFLFSEAARADLKVKALQLCRETLLSERADKASP